MESRDRRGWWGGGRKEENGGEAKGVEVGRVGLGEVGGELLKSVRA